MSTTSVANLVAFISALFELAGVSGVSSQDISGAVNVFFGVLALVSIIVAHFSHKAAQ